MSDKCVVCDGNNNGFLLCDDCATAFTEDTMKISFFDTTSDEKRAIEWAANRAIATRQLRRNDKPGESQGD